MAGAAASSRNPGFDAGAKRYRLLQRHAALYGASTPLAEVAVAVFPDLAWLEGGSPTPTGGAEGHREPARWASCSTTDRRPRRPRTCKYAAVMLPRVSRGRRRAEIGRMSSWGHALVATGEGQNWTTGGLRTCRARAAGCRPVVTACGQTGRQGVHASALPVSGSKAAPASSPQLPVPRPPHCRRSGERVPPAGHRTSSTWSVQRAFRR